MRVDQILNKNLGNLRPHAQTPLALAAEADNFTFARVDLQSPPNQEKVISVKIRTITEGIGRIQVSKDEASHDIPIKVEDLVLISLSLSLNHYDSADLCRLHASSRH
jgi:hypothetical protein